MGTHIRFLTKTVNVSHTDFKLEAWRGLKFDVGSR